MGRALAANERRRRAGRPAPVCSSRSARRSCWSGWPVIGGAGDAASPVAARRRPSSSSSSPWSRRPAALPAVMLAVMYAGAACRCRPVGRRPPPGARGGGRADGGQRSRLAHHRPAGHPGRRRRRHPVARRQHPARTRSGGQVRRPGRGGGGAGPTTPGRSSSPPTTGRRERSPATARRSGCPRRTAGRTSSAPGPAHRRAPARWCSSGGSSTTCRALRLLLGAGPARQRGGRRQRGAGCAGGPLPGPGAAVVAALAAAGPPRLTVDRGLVTAREPGRAG